MTDLIAAAGPLTQMLEVTATSIGLGTIVGSFFGGIRGAMVGGLKRSERGAVAWGYVGGLGGLTLLAIDILGKRFV